MLTCAKYTQVQKASSEATVAELEESRGQVRVLEQELLTLKLKLQAELLEPPASEKLKHKLEHTEQLMQSRDDRLQSERAREAGTVASSLATVWLYMLSVLVSLFVSVFV